MNEDFEAMAMDLSPTFRAKRTLLLLMACLFFGPATLAMYLVCIVLLFMQCFLIPAQFDNIAASILVLIGWIVLFLMVIAVHELGHAIAAHCVRWRILELCVGPLKLVRQGNKLSIKRHSRRPSPFGYVIAHPIDEQRYFRNLSIFALGGVAANAIIALLCLILVGAIIIFSDRPPHLEHMSLMQWVVWISCYWITAPLVSVATANILVVVGNLFPAQYRFFPSDGKLGLESLILWNLKIASPVIGRPGLGGMLFHGIRPREWDLDSIEQLQRQSDSAGMAAQGGLYGYYYELDHGNIEQAGELLNCALQAAEEVQGFDRSAIYLEAAFFEGYHQRNPLEARMWLGKVHVEEFQEYTFLRGEAAVLLAEGLLPKAADTAKVALSKTTRSNDFGAVSAEKEWLNAIVEACLEHTGKKRRKQKRQY